MPHIAPSQTLVIRDRITAATRTGRLQDWNERIGEIALLAEVNLSEINWSASPDRVARAIVEYANERNRIERLLTAISTYEATSLSKTEPAT